VSTAAYWPNVQQPDALKSRRWKQAQFQGVDAHAAPEKNFAIGEAEAGY
jgi:hypothetical protein